MLLEWKPCKGPPEETLLDKRDDIDAIIDRDDIKTIYERVDVQAMLKGRDLKCQVGESISFSDRLLRKSCVTF